MLTAVVLTHNEATHISRCLISLAFCDQILVIDDASTDGTVAIAKTHRAKVFSHPLANNFAAQRNFALSKITTGWVLFIDADEVVPPDLAREILDHLSKDTSFSGYYLPRFDYLWGRQLHFGDTGHTLLLRLAKFNSGFWQGQVHETWQVLDQIGQIAHHLDHFPHPTIADFLTHINFYSSLRAQELFRQGHRSNIWQILLYPPAKFVFLWLIKLGFLDGTAGFIHAMIMSFYSFLVRGKLYLS